MIETTWRKDWWSLQSWYKCLPFHRRQSQTSLPLARKYQPLSTQHVKSSVHLCPRLWIWLPGMNYPVNRQDLLKRNKLRCVKEFSNMKWFTYNIHLGQNRLQWHVLHVGGEAFIEPQVIPPPHSHQVSKPLIHHDRERLVHSGGVRWVSRFCVQLFKQKVP